MTTTYGADLQVEIPPTVESVRVLLVTCGQTEVEVKENGGAGTGNWCASARGRTVSNTGNLSHPYHVAVTQAYAWATREEKARLLRAALDTHLGNGS